MHNPLQQRQPKTLPQPRVSPLYPLPITLALSMMLVVIFMVGQLAGLALFTPLVLPKGESLTLQEKVLLGGDNGTVMSLAMIFTFFVVVGTIWRLIRAKRGKFADYMAIKPFTWRDFLSTAILLIVLNVLISGVGIWLEREPMLFMDKLAASAHPLWLLVLVIVIIVPIYEEMMFRGFMWSGLAGSRLGEWGASILTSMGFALIHGQYAAVEWVEIFLLAMLFSYARWRSGSLLLPIMLHIMNNGLAMAEFLG